MTYRFKENKYTFFNRNGKDCYVWFELRDYWNETIFKSSVHKVSLNIFRILKTKSCLRSHQIYI